MDKKQGFFSALREEVARGLSPARARRRAEEVAAAKAALRYAGGGGGEALAPLMEGPDPEEAAGGDGAGRARRDGWGRWVRGQLARAPSSGPVASAGGASAARRNDLRMLLGVMGAALAPVHVCAAEPLPHLSIKDTPIETSSAQYILQQYLAASGGQKLLSSVRNSYAMGKVRMVATECETAGRVVRNRMAARCAQGLDPLTTASMFAGARCIGERKVNGDDCFILKLCADPETLRARSEGLAEIIRHVLFGYFSQKSGLLVHLEDSHLTRIQSTTGGDAVYWETTINSFIEDYRPVEGIMIAHSGRSAVTLFRFGEVAMSHTKTRMEEAWSIEEVAFNVPGLSMDCFIPPTDIKSGSISETVELPQSGKSKAGGLLPCHGAKVAALEKADDNVAWSGALQRDCK
ncbi:unnamed protein product [Triticum turgidum subsp. durum]|uniref:Lipase-like protein n=1 Tax=Triticum turgidum subsp. durum TaxID=4567 RepID=A0A9R0X0W1_TRITD|nr:unnamed protein product [Triticum turgidum subsp. durum]